MTRAFPQLLKASALLACILLLSSCGADPVEDADMLEDGGLLCGSETCASGQGCCDYVCIDLTGDAQNCGACGRVCESTETCTDGECRCGQPACGPTDACCDFGGDDLQCIDVQADGANCGACGNSCGSAERCLNGTCACLAGDGSYERCDADELCCPGIGCRNVEVDPTNCGACGNLCGAGELCDTGLCACGDTTAPGIGAACSSGESCCGSPAQCFPEDDDACICGAARCSAGQICCEVVAGGNVTETCVRPDSDPDHCGSCGAGCGTAEVCRGASCRCSGGFADCDMDAMTGCESALAVDGNNCGGCGVACDPGEVCDGTGRCRLNCQADLTACDGSCINIYGDERNCGACTAACPSGEVCDGKGQCDESCQVGFAQCGNSCFNIYNDRAHCGACGVGCLSGTVCDGRGQCSLTCQPGYSDCSGSCYDLESSWRHCGACNNACAPGQVCNGAGQCDVSCISGFEDCGGACVDLQSDWVHCGACGVACVAGEVCNDGACERQCPASQTECNGQCVDLGFDDFNCGACGTVCGAGGACVAGTCEVQCPAPRAVCANSCVDVQFDVSNCGTCGNTCAMGEFCSGGTCQPQGACGAGFVDCAGVCVDTNTNVFNCGSCGSSCGAFATCSNGVCACTTGWEDCLDNDGLCDSNTQLNTNHCGSCGTVCGNRESCLFGICTCDPGFEDCMGNGCENLNSDVLFCGGCGTACAMGEWCVSGLCIEPPLTSQLASHRNGNNTCIIDSAGAVFCAGDRTAAQIGDGQWSNLLLSRDAPFAVPGLDGAPAATDIAMGHDFTCVVLEGGGMSCWGMNTVDAWGCNGTCTVGQGHSTTPVPYFDGTTAATQAAQVSAGTRHTCVRLESGGVACAGDDNYGQLGNGMGNDQALHGPVDGLDGMSATVVQVVSGADFSCALLDTGSVRCWGFGANGQMGNGLLSHAQTPVDVLGLGSAGRAVRKLAASSASVCALVEDGTVWCWGENADDKLGVDPVNRDVATPLQVPGIGGQNPAAVELAAGGLYFCVISDLAQTICWGFDDTAGCEFGLAGGGVTRGLTVVSDADGLVSIAPGAGYVLGLRADGSLVGWGSNFYGELALTAGIYKPIPASVMNLAPAAVEVSVGESTACAVHQNGSVSCWGSNRSGKLGIGVLETSLAFEPTAVSVSGLTDVVEVDVGGRAVCARHSTGALSCWGGTDACASFNCGPAPGPALAFDGVGLSAAQMDMGDSHICAVTTTGALYCWGSDAEGQLGLGAGNSGQQYPQLVPPFDGVGVAVAQVDVGESSDNINTTNNRGTTCVRTTSGAVYCWGYNTSGQVGDGTQTGRESPVMIMDGVSKTAIYVSVGRKHGCAILDDNSVECWGDNGSEQVGQPRPPGLNRYLAPEPHAVLDGTGPIPISLDAGSSHTCALFDDDVVRCWGENVFGQLGTTTQLGDPFGQLHAPQVAMLSGGLPTQLSAGEQYSDAACAVLDTGDVQCWGWGREGQLGNGGRDSFCRPTTPGYTP